MEMAYVKGADQGVIQATVVGGASYEPWYEPVVAQPVISQPGMAQPQPAAQVGEGFKNTTTPPPNRPPIACEHDDEYYRPCRMWSGVNPAGATHQPIDPPTHQPRRTTPTPR